MPIIQKSFIQDIRQAVGLRRDPAFTKEVIDRLNFENPKSCPRRRFDWLLREIENYSTAPLTERELHLSEFLLKRTADGPWYHGGLRGRDLGDELIPGYFLGANPRDTPDPSQSRLVSFTKDLESAQWYSVRAVDGGVIYEVEPVGRIQADSISLRALVCHFHDTKTGHARDMFYAVSHAIYEFKSPTARVLKIREIE